MVWHYWIAVALIPPTVMLVVGTFVMYLRKVVLPRYPRK